MFQFASPWFLVLLLILPVARLRRRRRHPPALRAPDLRATFDLPPSPALAAAGLLPSMKTVALILLVAALARPQWGTQRQEVTEAGVNIVLAVDISESMGALDFAREGRRVNRLEAVKGVVKDFVARRHADRIALVVFGSVARTRVPLTRDAGTLTRALEGLRIGAAGRRTAVGDAVGIALKRIADIPSRSNLIVLLTDGRSNSGQLDPRQAAAAAAARGVKIYTVGVGTRGRVPFPAPGGGVVTGRVDIDEQALREIAAMTGGTYYRAHDARKLTDIYATIDRLEKTFVKTRTIERRSELYPWFVLPACGLLALWVVLTQTRFLAVP